MTTHPDHGGVPALPRVAVGSRREVGLVNWLICRVAGLAAGTPAPALFLTLARHRRLFRGWLRFAGRLMPGGLLPRRETELVILRVATLAGSEYEFSHHARLGRRAGLGAEDLARVVLDPVADAAEWGRWRPREAAVLAATDRLHRERDLDDATWSALREHLDERQCLEMCLLVGHYEMLATTITALRIPPDPRRR